MMFKISKELFECAASKAANVALDQVESYTDYREEDVVKMASISSYILEELFGVIKDGKREELGMRDGARIMVRSESLPSDRFKAMIDGILAENEAFANRLVSTSKLADGERVDYVVWTAFLREPKTGEFYDVSYDSVYVLGYLPVYDVKGCEISKMLPNGYPLRTDNFLVPYYELCDIRELIERKNALDIIFADRKDEAYE